MQSLSVQNIAVRASHRSQRAVESAFDKLTEKYESSDNPVIIVAVAAAIVLGLGFIAFLTAQCISRGYRGFGGVVNIDWSGPFSAKVKFECFK